MLIGWLFKKTVSSLSWKSLAVGAAAAAFGPSMVRPALVSLVRTGLNVQDVAGNVYREAQRIKSEAEAQHAEAVSNRSLREEVEHLRRELAVVRAEFENANAA
jgi:hypothetical protein